MAFDPLRLRMMAYTRASRRGVDRRLWCYVDDDDTLESIQSPGFFNDPACNFGEGDWLLAQGTDGWMILTVMQVTPTGEITLSMPTMPAVMGVSQMQFTVLEELLNDSIDRLSLAETRIDRQRVRISRLRDRVRRLAARIQDHEHDDDDDDEDD